MRRADRVHAPWAARSATAAAVVLPRDQLSMLAEEGIGRDQGVPVTEYPSPEALGLCGQAPALGVGEPETARTELLSEDAILFLERVNNVTRLLVDPARDGHDEELQHLGNRRQTGRAEQRLSAVTNVATRRASSVESARRTASIGFLDSTPVDGARISLKTRTRTRPVGRGRHPPGRREAEAAQSACYGLVTGGGERLRAAGASTGSRPPLRRGRSRSACVVNARLRQAGEDAVRRAPPCVVSHVGFSVHREFLPPARATASMLRSGPFTRAGNRQASAVDEEMKAGAPWNAPKPSVEVWAPTGQRRVIRRPKVESHQHAERREKARCLTGREMEEKTQASRRTRSRGPSTSAARLACPLRQGPRRRWPPGTTRW